MSEQTKIQWCDHTFNPWEGCTKVSPGCLNCYAETRNHRFGNDNWGKGKPRRRTSVSNWKQPLKWNEGEFFCVVCGQKRPCPANDLCNCGIGVRRPRVFCASLADWLDDEVPIDWLADLLKLIHDTPNLDWLLLTKRPENFFALLQCAWRYMATRSDLREATQWVINWENRGQFPQNVWIGTSVEDQQRADERIPELLKIPAKIRFLSVEPMLGPIDFTHNWISTHVWHDSLSGKMGLGRREDPSGLERELTGKKIDWAIFGGESGPGARPCNIEWIRDAVKQCRSAGVATFVKQLGSKPTETVVFGRYGLPLTPMFQGQIKDKKGGDMTEWPEDLRIREFPGGALLPQRPDQNPADMGGAAATALPHHFPKVAPTQNHK